MNGKQLKNSILQWAIQGKLVPQDPNDKPAFFLLEKIRAEKERLVKEKKIKKDKNESIIFRGDDNSYYEKFLATGEVKCIDEEIPFEIPKGWEWCRLSLLIYPPKYGTSKKSSPSGILPVLRMGNIQNGEIVFDKLVYSNDLDDNKKLLLQYGDLLFNRTNSAELVGKTAIFRGQRNVIFAGYLILLRPILISSEYLNLLLNTPYARDYCNEVKTIGVQQCNINAEKISNLLIPVPNLHETVAIVEKVKNIALPIIKYGEFYQKLKHLNRELPILLRKSILQEAIQGKLVSQIADEGTAQELLEQIRREKWKLVKDGKLKKSALTDSIIYKGDDNKYWEKNGKIEKDITDEIPFEIPNTWAWCRLSNLVLLLSGRDLEPTQYNSVSNGIPYMTGASNFKDGTLIKNRWTDTPIVISVLGDLLITCKGTIGETAFNTIGDIHIARQIMALRSSFVDLNYIQYYLSANIQVLQKQANSMIPGISRDTLLNAIIPLPPLMEQARIVVMIKRLASIMSR